MLKSGWRTAFAVSLCLAFVAGCTGEGSPFDGEVAEISFETTTVPAADAGLLYNQPITFQARGGAALPDRFELKQGILPPGVTLVRDREDADLDGLPDPTGAFTGNARLLGLPREQGTFTFIVKAISTGANAGATDQPDLATERSFRVDVGEGRIAILTPTAAEGTVDPTVPAFPAVINFVNPADPQAFFSFAFLFAGGSGNNVNNIYLPRELELSVFDQNVADGIDVLSFDTTEIVGAQGKFGADISDGGWFVQTGSKQAQLGGFQSPRGPVGAITDYAGGAGLDPDWFQRTPGQGGPPVNSRRTFGDIEGLAGGDTTLGTPLPVQFSDYFSDLYEGTNPGFVDPPGGPVLTRRKYPFSAGEYGNAFFLPANALTPLRYNAIVEAIDTRGTATKADDVIARKAYIVQVSIPDIVIDSAFLPGGQAGVDYNEFVNASGGVPPLSFDLEWVDGALDNTATGGDALDKATFGTEIDLATGQFFGVPRASGTVELTVRVFAQVMNPVQSGAAFVPTGTVGEFAGTHPLTGRAGIHKTFPVPFAAPTAPLLTNTGLAAGVDGQSYNAGQGDTVVGGGGVPNLVPPPVGFVGTYPSSAVARTYTWTASYVRDQSYPGFEGTADPARQLPQSLVLDGDANSASNGRISGLATDRGFHPVTFVQTDFYVGDASGPAPANAQQSLTTLALSISPDTAVYLRGQSGAGSAAGLVDQTAQQAEARMVPLFLGTSLYRIDTGQPAELQADADLPAEFDILPVLVANGGSDAHVDKSIPSVSGFWPAESNRETLLHTDQTRAWAHLDQEFTWLQMPNATHSRVFLWAETETKDFGGSTGGTSKRYQQYLASGDRGILVLNPLTGDFWLPAILDNDDATHGSQFGAEMVMPRTLANDNAGYGTGYWKYYRDATNDTRWDREKLGTGLSSYIEANDRSTSTATGWNRMPQGRAGISVAASADGTWCATAMPGGDQQKILLWRTDRMDVGLPDVPGDHIELLVGKDGDGNDLPFNSAAILNLGGQNFSGTILSVDHEALLPDSLMFVDGGLLFLHRGNLDRVFGISLADGTLSSVDVNTRNEINSNGTGPAANATTGQYAPDTDYLRGFAAQAPFSVQFSFAGNKPASGAEGPTKLAFVAGSNRTTTDMAATNLSRDAIFQQGNREKAVLFLELGGGAFDLGAATVTDLTGDSALIYGDLLTPGRPGEEQDWLVVSDDGDYVAVVRDALVGSGSGAESVSSFTAYVLTFSTITTSPSSTFVPHSTDDLMIISTTGTDMDTAGGTQHVLFFGTRSITNNAGTPATPTYASARNIFNSSEKRINGLFFSQTGNSLIVNHAGGGASWVPKYAGGTSQFAVNPSQTGTFGFGAQTSVRIDFRSSTGGVLAINSMTVRNNLQGLSGIGGIGPTTVPINDTGTSDQLFWATFKSPNGSFLYYVSDQLTGRNFLVGFNISGATIGTHLPFVPFSPHGANVGFEQFDVNSFNYENRFASVPGGVTYPPSGRDGGGLVFVIGSDASAGATSPTDLEVYVFDANAGGDMFVLTSDVTTGTANAINHLYVSADGNFLLGQRSPTTGNSRDSRATLNGRSDLFAVTNVHACLGGAAPVAFVVSANMSHGATVALVGEGTVTGPQAVVYSAGTAGTNASWDDRNLNVALLSPGAGSVPLDSAASHYAILAGTRRLNDDPTASN